MAANKISRAAVEQATAKISADTTREPSSPAAIHRFLPDKPRRREQVNPVLRGIINDCLAGRKAWPLFIGGKVGTGKTCAALCLCDMIARSEYFTAAQICERFNDARFGRLESSLGYSIGVGDIRSRITGCDLFVLDELERADRATANVVETIRDVLELRDGKPLIVISNSTISDIGKAFDLRIASRIGSGSKFQLDGEDRRLLRQRKDL